MAKRDVRSLLAQRWRLQQEGQELHACAAGSSDLKMGYMQERQPRVTSTTRGRSHLMDRLHSQSLHNISRCGLGKDLRATNCEYSYLVDVVALSQHHAVQHRQSATQ